MIKKASVKEQLAQWKVALAARPILVLTAGSALAALGLLAAWVSDASTPATLPAAATSTLKSSGDSASYRVFVEGIQFASKDVSYRSAEFTYRPQITEGPPTGAGQNLMIGPEWKAKELPIDSKKATEYGDSYYFPLQVTASSPDLEGEITLVSHEAGFNLTSKQFSETFRFKLPREAGKITELKGDGGSKLSVRVMSICDFNVYDTLDLSGIKKSLRADLEHRGVRVFEETTAKELFSRPTNAIWIGDKVPQECVNVAVDVFTVKYGIPVKGVYSLSEDHHVKWYFNPFGITLGHSKELVGKPDLSKTYFSELVQKNTGHS